MSVQNDYGYIKSADAVHTLNLFENDLKHVPFRLEHFESLKM